jgi:hypothetical protein
MGNNWRFTLQHLGDRFADMVEATVVAARRSAASIVIDFQIKDLTKKRGKVAAKIGNRIIEMRDENPDLLSYDEFITSCYDELDTLLDRIDACYDEKQQAKAKLRRILNRFTCKCSVDNEAHQDSAFSA